MKLTTNIDTDELIETMTPESVREVLDGVVEFMKIDGIKLSEILIEVARIYDQK